MIAQCSQSLWRHPPPEQSVVLDSMKYADLSALSPPLPLLTPLRHPIGCSTLRAASPSPSAPTSRPSIRTRSPRLARPTDLSPCPMPSRRRRKLFAACEVHSVRRFSSSPWSRSRRVFSHSRVPTSSRRSSCVCRLLQTARFAASVRLLTRVPAPLFAAGSTRRTILVRRGGNASLKRQPRRFHADAPYPSSQIHEVQARRFAMLVSGGSSHRLCDW